MILGLPMWWAYAMLAPGLALTAVGIFAFVTDASTRTA